MEEQHQGQRDDRQRRREHGIFGAEQQDDQRDRGDIAEPVATADAAVP
ncbi:hypothetical protein IHQ71_13670 [Rhizobium sp. TH2]|nr:hypothetical protein [Rhizobium sp. TH2]UVC11530.1 hypothetical protein IHQ71_13670 [Rhizobium sp. TH2]